MTKSTTHVAQIATVPDGPDNDATLFALCTDGTIWRRYAFGVSEWSEIPLPPGAKRASRRARTNGSAEASAIERMASAVERAVADAKVGARQ